MRGDKMRTFVFLIIAILLSACSPRLDWREVHGDHWDILLPAKPESFSRPVDLDGLQVTMSMTATEVDGVAFAVGTATLPDAGQTAHALAAMKTAMVNNIHGKIRRERPNGDIEAVGTRHEQAAVLYGRFVAKERQVYQVILLGKESAIAPETIDMFFSSFQMH
jgi:hypothetical protein